MIEIDGSEKSGSGTIVRHSATLASLLHENLHVKNIRAKRSKPGLRAQHLKAVEACSEITEGSLKNAQVSSNEIFYYPSKKIISGNYFFDIKTAGSTTMLSQTILPLLLFADKKSIVEIKGGLFQDFAPAAHHLQNIVIPLLKRMGIEIDLEIIRPGYIPLGEGIIKLLITPLKDFIKPILLEKKGNIKKIKAISLSSHLEEKKVSERMKISLNENLKKSINLEAEVECINDTTSNQRGASLTCWIETDTNCIIGMDMAGKFGRSSEFIGKKVANMLIEDFSSKNATVDRYSADQLILYAALAKGTSKYITPMITDHIETNLWLIEKFLNAKSTIENNSITIHGIGYKNIY